MKTLTALTLTTLALLTACAADPTTKGITLPNGEAGLIVTCDLAAGDWGICYDAARKACNGTYKILDKNESTTPTQYGPLVKRSMEVKCDK